MSLNTAPIIIVHFDAFQEQLVFFISPTPITTRTELLNMLASLTRQETKRVLLSGQSQRWRHFFYLWLGVLVFKCCFQIALSLMFIAHLILFQYFGKWISSIFHKSLRLTICAVLFPVISHLLSECVHSREKLSVKFFKVLKRSYRRRRNRQFSLIEDRVLVLFLWDKMTHRILWLELCRGECSPSIAHDTVFTGLYCFCLFLRSIIF